MIQTDYSTSRVGYLHPDDIRLADFQRICEQQVVQTDYPLASDIVKNIAIYQADAMRDAANSQEPQAFQAYSDELTSILLRGPGVFVIQGFYPDTRVIEQMNLVFEQILEQESGYGRGDHFGKAGANARIWNSFQKSALINPEVFLAYFKNPLLKLVCEAWLGPNYQLTTQVNIVRPGGTAQVPHRDYHLGFQSPQEVLRYPAHVQAMSAQLTLQGAIAHSDMPIESGPTKLLPFSQLYSYGYTSYTFQEFIEYFEQHFVQLPLHKGDALFFSPALSHAAGSNQTGDIQRSANLIQASSAFAKPMETVNRQKICCYLYSELLALYPSLSVLERESLITAISDGYSFPSNLDTDPPLDGMAPESMSQMLAWALAENWPKEQVESALQQQVAKRQA